MRLSPPPPPTTETKTDRDQRGRGVATDSPRCPYARRGSAPTRGLPASTVPQREKRTQGSSRHRPERVVPSWESRPALPRRRGQLGVPASGRSGERGGPEARPRSGVWGASGLNHHHKPPTCRTQNEFPSSTRAEKLIYNTTGPSSWPLLTGKPDWKHLRGR